MLDDVSEFDFIEIMFIEGKDDIIFEIDDIVVGVAVIMEGVAVETSDWTRVLGVEFGLVEVLLDTRLSDL